MSNLLNPDQNRHFVSPDLGPNCLQRLSDILSGTLSECQTLWIQIRTDILSVLIWVQTVCKGYQIFFQEHYQNVKPFESRSEPTFCQSWSGSKLFAKVIRYSFRNTIRMSNPLNPDQNRHFVSPDLGPNCLLRLSDILSGTLIRMSYGLDPDQDRRSVGSNCLQGLQRLSADGKSHL